MGKPAPKFWWDFAPGVTDAVIVQSDWLGGEEIARFCMPADQSEREGLEPQILEAERLIEDFMAGRKTPDWKPSNEGNLQPRLGASENTRPASGCQVDRKVSQRGNNREEENAFLYSEQNHARAQMARTARRRPQGNSDVD